MPTTIKLKNSVTTTNAPSSLLQGEVAINITDKKVWVGNAATTPVQLLGDGGSASFTSIAFGAGTVSNPSITFTGDTNTGIYSPAADTIGFTQGGVESMRINSSGAIGIGTTNITHKLTVSSTIAASNTTGESSIHLINSTSNCYFFNSYSANIIGLFDVTATRTLFQFSRANNAWSFFTSGLERLIIDSGGKVGINITTPATQLHVLGEATFGGGSNTDILVIRGQSSNNQSVIRFDNSTGTDARFYIYSVADNELAFMDGTFTERMRINSSGNVGIGVQNPPVKLHIAKSGGCAFRIDDTSTNYWELRNDSNLIFDRGGTERMRITSGGDLLVGTSSAFLSGRTNFLNGSAGQIAMRHSGQTAGQYWYMGSESSSGVFIVYSDTTGGVYMTRGATAWTGNSDEKLKNITGEIQNGLEKVCSLRAAQFTWKADKENKPQVGLIAQDVQKVLPEVIDTNGDGHLGIRYTETIPLLVAAIKEQQTMIEELKAKITALENK